MLGRSAQRSNILEAGCGRKWNIALADVPFRLTGIDLDADALAYRTNVVGDLDEAIVGDLREVELTQHRYDVVFSAFVLETSVARNRFSIRWSTL